MALLTIINTGAIEELRLRVALAQAALGPALALAVSQAGQQVASDLSDAAPHGANPSEAPVGNDAPGPLADSFQAQPLGGSSAYAAVQVITTQPTKLGYVRRGHGPIRPVTKRALMWPGAAHPVTRVRAVPPNDFVTPTLDASIPAVVTLLEAALEETVLPILEGM